VPRVPPGRRRRVSHTTRHEGGLPSCRRLRPCRAPPGAPPSYTAFPFRARSFFFLFLVEGTARGTLPLARCAAAVLVACFCAWHFVSCSLRCCFGCLLCHGRPCRGLAAAPLTVATTAAAVSRGSRPRGRPVPSELLPCRGGSRPQVGEAGAPPPLPHRLDTRRSRLARPPPSGTLALTLLLTAHTPPRQGTRHRQSTSSALPGARPCRRRARAAAPVFGHPSLPSGVGAATPLSAVSGHPDQLGERTETRPRRWWSCACAPFGPLPARGPRWMATATLRAPRIVLLTGSDGETWPRRARGGVCA